MQLFCYPAASGTQRTLEQVLKQLHSNRTIGRCGAAKTLGRLRDQFYWVNLQQRCGVNASPRHSPLVVVISAVLSLMYLLAKSPALQTPSKAESPMY